MAWQGWPVASLYLVSLDREAPGERVGTLRCRAPVSGSPAWEPAPALELSSSFGKFLAGNDDGPEGKPGAQQQGVRGRAAIRLSMPEMWTRLRGEDVHVRVLGGSQSPLSFLRFPVHGAELQRRGRAHRLQPGQGLLVVRGRELWSAQQRLHVSVTTPPGSGERLCP